MSLSFTEALMTQKRKARLQGRPITTAEVRGISEGYGGDAAEKLARLRALQLEETEGEKTRKAEAMLQKDRIASGEKEAAAQRASVEQMAAERVRLDTERLAAEKVAAREAAEGAEAQRKTTATMVGGMAGGYAGLTIGTAGGAAAGGAAAGGAAAGGGGAAAGAATGAQAGSVYPVVGTIIGALAGAAIGYFASDACMIVSACTDPDSPEVKIARMYKHLCVDETTLTGYYALGHIVVPAIERFGFVRRLVKKCLVDRLIDAGAWALGLQDKPRYLTSRIVADTFLDFCYGIGTTIQKKMKQSEV